MRTRGGERERAGQHAAVVYAQPVAEQVEDEVDTRRSALQTPHRNSETDTARRLLNDAWLVATAVAQRSSHS